jgi:diaminopimelate decarboxylase
MSWFHYANGQLCAERVPLSAIADRFGTPCYVYSRASIEENWKAYERGFGSAPHLLCFAVKANGNLAVLDVLARLGSGFDIVSGGELERVLAAGGEAGRVVFSGVGKRSDEIRRALAAGIHCFNVESRSELLRLSRIAGESGRPAPVSIRVNPDIDAGTHPYIATGLRENKFGIPIEDAAQLYREASTLPWIQIVGIACHIGSQVTSLAPFQDAFSRVLALADTLRAEGLVLRHIDIGGGLGIRYRDESPPQPAELLAALCASLPAGMELHVEPGRSIVGNAGVLLTRVEYIKGNGQRRFAIVDAAMNDLLRPALYNAWQDIMTVRQEPGHESYRYDVVGPVCESSDVLGRDRLLSVAEGELLAVCGAGAYGACMASNYNGRPRPAEVIVDGEQVHEARRREDLSALMAGELRLPG